VSTLTASGKLFADRYRLERKLGSGGMADVWLAEDQELGRKVAVKILHERYASDEQFVERFRREATHAAGLSHPNIVSVFDRGATNGSYFIVMEYVEGRTLKELIVTRGPCPVPVAVSYVRQVLAALRYAHKNGIIHRDIKPHNVIVDREGRVKVADFGIARAGTSQMTEAGSIIGTAQYLSPEQARGALVDESSDLYSTAVVLFELLTGEVPFNGETPVEIAMKHLSQPPPAPSSRRTEIPRDLDLVVLRALAKEPRDRYRAAADMDRDLELVSRGEHVGNETADAATMVAKGAGIIDPLAATAATQIAGRGARAGDERYRAYEAPVGRRRSPWPWLIALAVAIALGGGGYWLYTNLQDQLESTKTFAVQDYRGREAALAAAAVRADGFDPLLKRVTSTEFSEGQVFEQEPDPGARLEKGQIVVLRVSAGKPEVIVPDVRGRSEADAVAELVAVGLKVKPFQVNSDRPTNTVISQAPVHPTVLVAGSEVRINISKGPKPIAVPSVVGMAYDAAAQQLQSASFFVRREDADSDTAAGIVIAQDPPAYETAGRGAGVTLTVSRGPKEVEVPEVIGADRPTAAAALRAVGFKVDVVLQNTEDATADKLVLAQEPIPLAKALPGSRVKIYVGKYVPPIVDQSPPATPADLIGTAAGSSSATLTWEASTDDSGQVAGYKILRDGVQVGDQTATTYVDTGLAPGTSYAYSVAAYDAAGNISDVTGVTVTTAPDPAAPVDVPPANP
jgi:eukaryotic-like serine/threonine-protein kinase